MWCISTASHRSIWLRISRGAKLKLGKGFVKEPRKEPGACPFLVPPACNASPYFIVFIHWHIISYLCISSWYKVYCLVKGLDFPLGTLLRPCNTWIKITYNYILYWTLNMQDFSSLRNVVLRYTYSLYLTLITYVTSHYVNMIMTCYVKVS